jgi:endonuclease/exonuclease/phosphatase family metal-dependent hydrolase
MSLNLQKKLDDMMACQLTDKLDHEKVLTHSLATDLSSLLPFSSYVDLEKSDVYHALKPSIDAVTNGYEYGCFSDRQHNPKPFYRAILWHLEHGVNFTGILETLRNRAFVSQADIYFFPCVDIGTMRSRNLNIIRDLAIELGYNYYFATSFLHLDDVIKSGTGQLGLEGNAIMTKLPLANLRVLSLPNYFDIFEGADKRLGCSKVLMCDVLLGDDKLTLVCINLPGRSSQWERYKHVFYITQFLKTQPSNIPILIGGDLKTSCYNSKSSLAFLASVFNKCFRGYQYIKEEHHSYPEKHFDRRVFQTFHKNGFQYKSFNEQGVGSFHCEPAELLKPQFRGDSAYTITKKLLKSHTEKQLFKYDWFAASDNVIMSESPQAERPKVIRHLFHDGNAVSNHDPVLLDFEVKA